MTPEERGTYSTYFSMANPENTQTISGANAASFMRKSGLDKQTLKKIWLIAAQTNNKYLEREEFYIAMRLIALAQNNVNFSRLNIENNSPIPPLPKFNLKNEDDENSPFFNLNEENKLKYKKYFDSNKESSDNISLEKSILMWKNT